ncbi:MAG: hypothetical protein MRY78_17050 [Saprospiraceae bacterium]|nr:hypothetical protein [Saprospiraceae bacterium]
MNTPTNTITVEAMVDHIEAAVKGQGRLELHNASYETGLLGFSLFYAYLARFKDDEAYLPIAEEYFQKGMGALDIHNFTRTYNTDSIDAHLSHIGRFIGFCRRHKMLDFDAEGYMKQLDDILFDLLKSKVSIKDFDMTSGAMASGFYFLSRLKDGYPVEEQITYAIHSIENFAEKDKDGDYFWKSPSLFNRIYLGISHGSCLIMSFLLTAYEHGIEQERCVRIIEKAMNFLLKQYRKSKYKGLFPNKIGDKVEPMQFALCYGDLGTGYVLYRAAKVLQEDRIKTFADMVLDDCLLRSREDNLTLDASIFYGASGLIIAFDKLATISGDTRFKERAQYWYDQIPAYGIYQNNFAGFQSRLDEKSRLWNISYGWGILGIGTTLMAYSGKDLPALEELSMVA